MKNKKYFILIILLLLAAAAAVVQAVRSFPRDTAGSSQAPSSTPTASPAHAETLTFYGGSTAALYEGCVYVNVNGTRNDLDVIYSAGAYDTLQKTRAAYRTYPFAADDSPSFQGMKLNACNVKKVCEFLYGQSLNQTYGLIMLKEDGTLSYISYGSLLEGTKDVLDIKGITDVSDVFSAL